MDNEEKVLEPQVETGAVTETTAEVEFDASALLAQLEKEKEIRQKVTARALKAEAEKKALEAQLSKTSVPPEQSDEVTKLIKIGNALEGLDKTEKEYLASQHKLSQVPLEEIRESVDFKRWQKSYRDELAVEAALKPNADQVVETPEQSWLKKLQNAPLAEKEKILEEAGLWKNTRPGATRANIGQPRPL